jgi:hypothetical protein
VTPVYAALTGNVIMIAANTLLGKGHAMLDIVLDALLDTLKTLPFLFGAYLLIEFLEHRASEKLTGALQKLGPFGPLGGALLGLVPQCGFSVAAANFFAGRLITPGTLIAVFLATSDEALPILISQPGALPDLLVLLGVKLVSGAVFGLLTDLVWKHLPHGPEHPFTDLCKDCGCEDHGIFRSALVHTVKIALFLLIINLVLGGAIHLVGEERISQVLLSGSVLQTFVAALIGFLPNCASSVILTELYLSGSLSFGAAVAGLCTGAGLGIAVLFKYNRHLKENLLLTGILYLSAVITGLLCGMVW